VAEDLMSGKVVFTQPRFLIFRTYFLNHAVHTAHSSASIYG